jgi:hypothetical protein
VRAEQLIAAGPKSTRGLERAPNRRHTDRMSANKVCLVLKPGVGRADFERAAADAGFAFFETRPGDGDRVGYEQVWGWPNLDRPTAGVYYIESPFVSFPYIVVKGSELPLLTGKLTDRLPVYSRAELIDDAMNATAHDDQVRAINRLALGFVECEPAVFGIMMNSILAGATPLLREAAVNALGFNAWPQFRWVLEKLSAEDPAPNVRERAAALLAVWPAAEQAN